MSSSWAVRSTKCLLRAAVAGPCRRFARVATPLEEPHLPDRPLDDEEDEYHVPHVAAEELYGPLASSFHRHAEDTFPPPLEALGQGGDSYYDDEYAENRDMSDLQRPRKKNFGVLAHLALLEQGKGRARKPKGTQFDETKPIRIRVLDVDAVPLQDLHHAFMHALVRRRPAEVCVNVASRLAQFRDKYKTQPYENMLRDCGRLFGPTHGPELVALFSRCHATISLPFMLDYIRKYGQFSRAFIAKQVDRSLKPAFFDFLRYEKRGGVRPLPLVVSQPWALDSYTRLMAKSTMRSYLHSELKLHGHVPAGVLEADTAERLDFDARLSEALATGEALKVPSAIDHRESVVPRPKLLDAIIEAEHSGKGWDPEQARSAVTAATDSDEDDEETKNQKRGSYRSQFERVVPDIRTEASLDIVPHRENQENKAPVGDELDFLSDRWWSRPTRLFFRHDFKAYRLVEGKWARVADPRGPRHRPVKRHKSRSDRKEEGLRRKMRGEAMHGS